MLDPYLTWYMKIKSKWIKDLNRRAKIIKPLEGNKGVNLCNLEVDNGSLNMTPKARTTKVKKQMHIHQN